MTHPNAATIAAMPKRHEGYRRQPSGVVLLAVAAPLIWGVSYPATKVALASVDPLSFMTNSRLLGVAVLGLALLASPDRRRTLQPRILLPGMVLGGLLCAAAAAQTFGLRWTTATNAGFITGLYVAFVPLLTVVISRTRIARRTVVVALVAVVGLGLLSVHGIALHTGDGLVVGSAIIFAAHLLALSRWAPSFDPLALAFMQLAAAAAFHVALALAMGVSFAPPGGTWPLLLFNGVLGSGVAYLFQTMAQQWLTPERVAVLLACEALTGALTSAAWLGDRLTTPQWAGAGLLLVAMLVSGQDSAAERSHRRRDQARITGCPSAEHAADRPNGGQVAWPSVTSDSGRQGRSTAITTNLIANGHCSP
jgi:drug/metabolite transporter (DMT)-like permease